MLTNAVIIYDIPFVSCHQHSAAQSSVSLISSAVSRCHQTVPDLSSPSENTTNIASAIIWNALEELIVIVHQLLQRKTIKMYEECLNVHNSLG